MKISMGLSNYIYSHNEYRKAFGQKPWMLTSSDIPQILDCIENELSPENLSCDGQIPHHVVIKKAKILNTLYREVQKIQMGAK